jgi:hypothetical protein
MTRHPDDKGMAYAYLIQSIRKTQSLPVKPSATRDDAPQERRSLPPPTKPSSLPYPPRFSPGGIGPRKRKRGINPRTSEKYEIAFNEIDKKYKIDFDVILREYFHFFS